MKSVVPFLFLAVFCASQVLNLRAATPPATYQAEAERLAKELPSLYWYASDACLRETSRHGPQTIKYDRFVNTNRGTIQKTTPVPGNPSRVDYEIDLADSQDSKEHWVFEFGYDGQKWEAKSAYKYFGKERTFDLYSGDIFMGSMKPYVQKALDTFTRHGSLADAFPASGETVKRSTLAIPFKAGDIIEQYRHYEVDDGLFPDPSKSFAHTKWKVREIARDHVEVELVEGRFALRDHECKDPGFILRLASSENFRETFPDASPLQEIVETFKKVGAPGR